MTKLLLVEDDKELAELVREYLVLNQFEVDVARNGRDALGRLSKKAYEAVLLDIMLPGIDGLEVLRQVRRTSSTPVIIISARGADIDKIVGLELGADDYLEKPFNHRELLARVKALLRRAKLPAGQSADVLAAEGPEPNLLKIGDLRFNLLSRTLYYDDIPVGLTGMEYALLLKLAQQLGEVISKETLSMECLGRRLTPFDRSIDTHMSKIRKKLALIGSVVEIKAMRGRGYCLAC